LKAGVGLSSLSFSFPESGASPPQGFSETSVLLVLAENFSSSLDKSESLPGFGGPSISRSFPLSLLCMKLI